MDSLTRSLIKDLLPESIEGKEVTAVFGGGFKPPTSGHLLVIQKALQDHPEIDNIIIYVGSKARDGITQDQAYKIWNEYYKSLIDKPVRVEKSVSPIGDIYRYAKDNPEDSIYWIIGAREGREDDLQDISLRSVSIDKYPNLNLKTISTPDRGMSGTNARQALINNDKEAFKSFIPSNANQDEIWNILTSTPLNEGDPKKGTGKKPKGSGRRLYTDENPKDTVKVKFSTRQDIIDTLNKTSFKSKSHARQSQVINLIHQRVRAALSRTKDPKKKAKLRSAFEYIKKRKEASKKKTQRLKKQKTNEAIDTNFDKVKFYYDYYTNVSPSTFGVTMEENNIKISNITEPYSSNFGPENVKQIPVNQNLEESLNEDILEKTSLVLPRGKKIYLQAEEEDYDRGIIVELSEEGGYKINYWYGDDAKVYPVEVEVDGESIKPDAKEVYMKFHPYLKKENIDPKVQAKHKGKSSPFGSAYKPVNEQKTTHEVIAKGIVFEPKNITINVGDTVKWVNEQGAHNVNGEKSHERNKDNPESFGNKVGTGWTYKFTFTKPGLYKYHCDPHLSADMVGTVKVKGKIDEGDTYEKMAAKGKKAGSLKQGTVRKRLNIPKDKKIPLSLINKELARLRKMDKDKKKKGVQLGDKNQKYYKALQLAKTLKTTTNVNETGLEIAKKNMDDYKRSNQLNENATYSSHIDYKQEIIDLTKHMLKKGMNIKPLPKVIFKHNDKENAQEFLGRTAYYNPNSMTIVLYTEGRHPKDIARSFAHEMIHHIQKLEDRLENITTTNTLEDDHLNNIEREAYTRGNMVFRNYTDGKDGEEVTSLNEKEKPYKHKYGFDKNLGKDPFGLNQFARELASLEENEDNEGFRSYKSTFAPQVNITIVFKEYDKYKDLKSLFKEYGYGFYSPKTKTIVIDGEVFIDSNLTFNDLKFVEAHEISHLIMNHSGPRSDKDELDADLGAYILLKSQNLPVDNLKKQFKFRHGIEFNEKLLDRVKDKF